MAILSIQVPDARQADIQAAFGRDVSTGTLSSHVTLTVRTPATQAEVILAIQNFIKARVAEYKGSIASKTASDAVSGEVW